MAKLNSIKRDYSLTILPLNYESKDETWVITEIIFVKDGKDILKKVASIIQDYEVEEIIKRLGGINYSKIDYTSDFLEPNFKLSLRGDAGGNVRVIANYTEGEDYENRESEKNYHKTIEFFVDKECLGPFIEDLQSELENLK